jgi:rSAM/selenodomain-associated transferase 1
MRFPESRLLVFAKAPVLGRVKTRLIPLLGEQGALDFHVASIRCALEQRAAMQLSPVVLYIKDQAPAWLTELCQERSIDILQQQGANLGERMLHAATEQLSQSRHVVLTGTDCLTLTSDLLTQLYQSLEENDAAIIGAEDGGYVALGLTQLSAALFTQFPFGNAQVYQNTVDAMQTLDWRYAELTKTWDVDRSEDIQRWIKGALPQGENAWYEAIKAAC